MNEDIIRMAREAREQVVKTLPPRTFDLDLFHERFAALVRADERERIEAANAAIIKDLHAKIDQMLSASRAAIRARGQA
jgi:isochorismate hydrolase